MIHICGYLPWPLPPTPHHALVIAQHHGSLQLVCKRGHLLVSSKYRLDDRRHRQALHAHRLWTQKEPRDPRNIGTLTNRPAAHFLRKGIARSSSQSTNFRKVIESPDLPKFSNNFDVFATHPNFEKNFEQVWPRASCTQVVLHTSKRRSG